MSTFVLSAGLVRYCTSSRVTISIGIGKSAACQDLSLQAFHSLRLCFLEVIEAQQVQRAMDQHVRPMCPDSLALLLGFASHHGSADDEIAQRPGCTSRQSRYSHCRK